MNLINLINLTKLNTDELRSERRLLPPHGHAPIGVGRESHQPAHDVDDVVDRRLRKQETGVASQRTGSGASVSRQPTPGRHGTFAQ